MAYFSNGMEADLWQSSQCQLCRNWKDSADDEGCPIWDAHVLYNYDGVRESKVGALLHILIPMEKSPQGDFAGECSMFDPIGETDEPSSSPSPS